MQICKVCGEPVKYIAINSSQYVIVDPMILEVVSENGHRHKAYKKHKCKDLPEKKENASE
jgi:hypothetical protein